MIIKGDSKVRKMVETVVFYTPIRSYTYKVVENCGYSID